MSFEIRRGCSRIVPMRWPISVLATILSLSAVHASQGDRSPAYSRCVAYKMHSARECDHYAPSLPLRLTRWTCEDDIRYRCTQELTEKALSLRQLDSVEHGGEALFFEGGELEGLERGEMVQFHGKWPFKRWNGIQEPLSVLFSLLNLLAHYQGYRLITLHSSSVHYTTRSAKEKHALESLYKNNALVGINSWFWSIVFHTRDNDWTEKADYWSAGLGIGYGLYLAIYRIAKLHRPTSDPRIRGALKWPAISLFLAHCTYLSIGRFDYGYNMKANLVVGVVQILLWTTWSCRIILSSRSPSLDSLRPSSPRILPLVPLALLLLSTAFEILDFAPIPSNLRLLDAHALWHLSTIFVVGLWYRFLAADLRHVAQEEEGGKMGLRRE